MLELDELWAGALSIYLPSFAATLTRLYSRLPLLHLPQRRLEGPVLGRIEMGEKPKLQGGGGSAPRGGNDVAEQLANMRLAAPAESSSSDSLDA